MFNNSSFGDNTFILHYPNVYLRMSCYLNSNHISRIVILLFKRACSFSLMTNSVATRTAEKKQCLSFNRSRSKRKKSPQKFSTILPSLNRLRCFKRVRNAAARKLKWNCAGRPVATGGPRLPQSGARRRWRDNLDSFLKGWPDIAPNRKEWKKNEGLCLAAGHCRLLIIVDKFRTHDTYITPPIYIIFCPRSFPLLTKRVWGSLTTVCQELAQTLVCDCTLPSNKGCRCYNLNLRLGW